MDKKPLLIAYKHSANLHKILAVAKASKYELDVVELSPNQPEVDEWKQKSSTHSIPVLQCPDGQISETVAIMTYIGLKGGLAGNKNDYERAQLIQWQQFSGQEIGFNKMMTIYPIFGFMEQPNPEKAKVFGETIKKNLISLNNHLNGRKYLLGDELSSVDIELWANLKHYFQLYFVSEMRKKVMPNVEAWFNNLASQSFIKNVFGAISLCKAVQKPPKLPEKPKEEEKKPSKHHAEKGDEEESDEEEKTKKPKVDPASEFPPTTYDFDAFKKEFMNSQDQAAVLKKFWNEIDKNAFSIYYVKYQKLEKEGKEQIECENRRDFFTQKIEQYRRYAFASLGVYGEPGNYDVKGVWLWRGKGIPFFMRDHESFEWYDKKELDMNNEEDRKTVEEYWLNRKPGVVVGGQKLVNVELFR